MSIKLNPKCDARSLVSAGKIEHGAWDGGSVERSAKNAGAFLAIDDSHPPDEKGHWMFPVVSGGRVNVTGVGSAAGYAEKNGYDAVAKEAKSIAASIKSKPSISASADGYDYASTQITLPKEISDRVHAIAKSIPDEDLIDGGRETDPHVTVKYGLHHSSAGRVRDAIKNEMPVRFAMGRTRVFPATDDRPSDVLVADVHSGDLQRLNGLISSSAPHVDTHPSYQPHATIAYLKPGAGMKYAYRDDLAGIEGTCDSVTHSDHDGTETEIPLAGKTRQRRDMLAASEDGFILALADAGEGAPLPMALEGYPSKNSEGQPIHYRRMKIVPQGDWKHCATGEALAMSRDRKEEWIRNTNALIASGRKPFVTPKHLYDDSGNFANPDARDTLGYVEKLERSGDDLFAITALHGDESLSVAAKNSRSIGVDRRDLRDAKGTTFSGEALHHLALCPNPALPELGGTMPIAASADSPPVSIYMISKPSEGGKTPNAADSRRSFKMSPELAKQVREKLGLSADVPDDQLDNKVAEKAITLSAEVATLTKERDDAKLALDADGKEPDALSTSLITRAFKTEREQVVASGVISEAGMKEVDALMLNGGKPTRVALSLSAGSTDPLYLRLCDIIRRNPGIKTANNVVRGNPVQVLPALSGDKQDATLEDGKKDGAAYQQRQQESRGFSVK